MLEGFHHIQHLPIEKLAVHCIAVPPLPNSFADALAHFAQLQSLELDGDVFADLDFTKLLSLPHLTELELTHPPRSPSFIDFISSCATLKSLCAPRPFDCSDPQQSAAVTAIVNSPSRIEKLQLPLDSPSVDQCRMIARMPHLRDLTLSLHKFPAEHFDAMAAEKPKWTRLSLYLYASSRVIGVVALLNSLTCLEEWHNADCCISADDLHELKLPSLRKVSLDLYSASDVDKWADFICAQPCIEKVIVIDDEFRSALRDALVHRKPAVAVTRRDAEAD